MRTRPSAITAAFRSARDVVNTAFRAVRDVARSVFTAIRDVVRTVVSAINTAFRSARDVVNTAFRAVRDVARGVFDAIRDYVQWPIDKLKDLVSYINGTVDGVWSGIKDAARAAFDTILSPIQAVIDKIQSLRRHRQRRDRRDRPDQVAVAAVLAAWKLPQGKAAPAVRCPASPASPAVLASAPAWLAPRAGGGVTINISGALDPDAVARQIDRILTGRLAVSAASADGGRPVMAAPNCVVVVAGERFADTGRRTRRRRTDRPRRPVDLTWGRGNTFDQPSPATCSFAVLDRPGGTLFTDRLHIGDPLEVHAAGDIAQGTPRSTSPSTAGSNRCRWVRPGTRDRPSRRPSPTVVAAPTAAGVRSIQATLADGDDASTDPAGRVHAWRTRPAGTRSRGWVRTNGPGVAVRPALNGRRRRRSGSARRPAEQVDADRDRRRPRRTPGATRAWHDPGRHGRRARDRTADDWLGVSVTVDLATWAAPYGPAAPYAWTAAPGTWADYAADRTSTTSS